MPFCSLARISPTFCSVASFPIESRPCFSRMASQRSASYSPSSGDHYNSVKAGASCWPPCNCTWTATLDYVQKTLHFGALLLATQDGRSEYARDERSGLLVLPSARCAATPQRSDPSLNNQICSLRAKPARCDFARLALRISQHRSASSKRKPRYCLCTILVLPARSQLCPRAGILE